MLFKTSNRLFSSISKISLSKFFKSVKNLMASLRGQVLFALSVIIVITTLETFFNKNSSDIINESVHSIIDNEVPISTTALYLLDNLNGMLNESNAYLNGDASAESRFKNNFMEFNANFSTLSHLVEEGDDILFVETLANNFANEVQLHVFDSYDPFTYGSTLQTTEDVKKIIDTIFIAPLKEHHNQTTLFIENGNGDAEYIEDIKKLNEDIAILMVEVMQMREALNYVEKDSIYGSKLFFTASANAKRLLTVFEDINLFKKQISYKIGHLSQFLSYINSEARALFSLEADSSHRRAVNTVKSLQVIYVNRIESILGQFVASSDENITESGNALARLIQQTNLRQNALRIFVILIFVIISIGVLKDIIRPVLVLEKNIEQMKLGKYDNIFSYRKNNEIGRIVSAIKEFQNKLVELDELRENDKKRIEKEHNSQLQKAFDALKESEEDLRMKNISMLKVNAELRQFVHIASHDLREPMKNIVGYASVLQHSSEKELGTMGAQALTRITSSCDRMLKLIDDLRSLATLTTDDQTSESVKLRSLLSDVLVEYNTELDAKKTILDIVPLPDIHGYALALRQVIDNIISNAIKYGAEPLYLSASFEEDEKYYYISFKNNIPAATEFDDRILLPFYRGSNSNRNSSGIGLALSKKIIEDLHDGEIIIENIGKVSDTFVITLKFQKDNLLLS